MVKFILMLVVSCLMWACTGDHESSVDTSEFSYTKVIKESVAFSEASGFAILSDSKDILTQVGSSHVKLIFRDESLLGDLVYWDSDENRLVNLNCGFDAYHPEISPDGKWVAFSTLFEGFGGASDVYVQNLETGKVLQLAVAGAAVPRWRVLENGDTALVYVDNAGLTQMEEWKSYGTWLVTFSKEQFGMPSKLFNGAFVGVSHDFLFAVAGGSDFIRRQVRIEDGDSVFSDTLWYGGEQVCNLSLAKDSSLRTSFLDMAGREGLSYVGSFYKPHQQLFVMDQNGKLVQAVPSPEGYAFDHSEWISWGNFQVVTLQDFSKDLAHTRVALVNMSDSSVTELVAGEDMYHPAFWVER